MKLRARGGTWRRAWKRYPALLPQGALQTPLHSSLRGYCFGSESVKAFRCVPVLEKFTIAITSGFKAMAVILAYLMIFMIGIDLAEAAGI